MYYVLFADDTNVFISGNNLRKLINTLHIELDKLYAWLQSNKLTLNLLKTHYIVFHRAKHKHMDVKLCINKVPIQQVDYTKFLGVIILNSDVHNYNTRQAHHIQSFKENNEFIYKTFKFQSVYIWNTILQNINVSFPTFKHLLKRFLLNNNTSVRYDK